MSMMKRVALLALAGLVALGAGAQSEELPGAYAGVLVSRLSSSESGFSPQPTAVSGLIGYAFAPGFGIEGRAGTGLGSDNVSVAVPGYGTANIAVKVKSYFGGYLRGTLPVGDSVGLYALAGYADGKIEGSALGYTASASASGFSWFIGGEARFGEAKRHGLAVEWGRVLSSTDSLSAVYRLRF